MHAVRWRADALETYNATTSGRPRLTERAKPNDLERIMRKVLDAPVDLEDTITPDLANRLPRLR